MPSFRTGFESYYPPSAEDRRRVLTEGMICLDANVLLDAYRFGPRARNDLLNTMEMVRDRLWIPNQVAFEFHKNRLNVIAGLGKTYKELIDSLHGVRNVLNSEVVDKARKLLKTIDYSSKGGQPLIAPVVSSIENLAAALETLKEEHGISLDNVHDDPILSRFELIFDGRVGEKLTEADEDEAKKEAARRIKESIPPGYKDADKSNPSGDYLVWKQMLIEAKSRNKSILFVTRDLKDDWFRREGGKYISARPELIKEAKEEAGVDFVILETPSFLVNAKAYLHANVSESSIEEAKELPPLPSARRAAVERRLAALKYAKLVEAELLENGFDIQDVLSDVSHQDFTVRYPNSHAMVNLVVKHRGHGREVTVQDIELFANFGKSYAPWLLVSNGRLSISAAQALKGIANVHFVTWRSESDTSRLLEVLARLEAEST